MDQYGARALDWLNTRFYYEVDDSRGDDAKETLEKRRMDPKCGCYMLEFDECVRTQQKNGCELSKGIEDLSQFACGPNEKSCGPFAPAGTETGLMLAQQRAEGRFIFVGLTEEYVRSIRMLEVLLPEWFDGASELLLNLKLRRETGEENSITGTSMTGCLSKESKRLLTEDKAIRGALDFYANIQERFWRRYASLEDSLTNASLNNAMMRLKSYDSPLLAAQTRPKACQ